MRPSPDPLQLDSIILNVACDLLRCAACPFVLPTCIRDAACRLALAERAAGVSGCMVKSPLLIGSDVRSIASDSLALLKNKELIA